jgi:hypothetical protein
MFPVTRAQALGGVDAAATRVMPAVLFAGDFVTWR